VSLGFGARSVTVDNFTSSYVRLPDVGIDVPPWVYGAVVKLAPPTNKARASLVATVPAIPGPPVPTQQATLTWTDADLAPSAGHLLQQSTVSQSQELGDVVGAVGTITTTTFALPAGTQSIGFRTIQTGGGSLSGTAALTFEDADTFSKSTFFGQNPVITNGWAFFTVSELPSSGLTVILDMSAVTGANGQFTTSVVALPYVAAVGVTTFPGGSVAIKPSSGNLIMATGDTQMFYNSLTNPGAGATVVATGTLAVGHYRVRLRAGYGLTADTIEDNMKLVLSGIKSYTNLRVPAAANGAGVDRLFEFLNVDTSAALHVETIGAHVAAGSVYWASLDVTPLSSL
jgi:hypothetical protein